MSTYRQYIYMVADLVKQISDDSTFTESHIAFLLNKYRNYLLKQKYNNKAQEVPLSNYQTICTSLIQTPMVAGCPSESCISKDVESFLRSKTKIPFPLTFSDVKASIVNCSKVHTFTAAYDEATGTLIGSQLFQHYITDVLGLSFDAETHVFYTTTCKEDAEDMKRILIEASIKEEEDWSTYYTITEEDNEDCLKENAVLMGNYSNVTIVDKERFNYVGYNKYLKNVIYGTIGPDNYIYIKPVSEVDFNKVYITAIFEDPDSAYSKSDCNNCADKDKDSNCDEWDNEFPIEDALSVTMISMVVRDILGASYRPKDPYNNASDDLASIQTFIRQNMKDRYMRETTDVDNE